MIMRILKEYKKGQKTKLNNQPLNGVIITTPLKTSIFDFDIQPQAGNIDNKSSKL